MQVWCPHPIHPSTYGKPTEAGSGWIHRTPFPPA